MSVKRPNLKVYYFFIKKSAFAMRGLISAILCIFIALPSILSAQEDIQQVFDFTLSYRGLTRNDITIPVNLDKEKSPRNDAKLILPIVKDLMKNPLRSFEFMDSVKGYKNLNLDELVSKMGYLNTYAMYIDRSSNTGIRFSQDAETLGAQLIELLQNRKSQKERLLAIFSKDEKSYLSKHIYSIFSDTEGEEGSSTDIFKYNRQRDSSIAVSRKTMEVLEKIDRSKLAQEMYAAFYWVNLLNAYINGHAGNIKGDEYSVENESVTGNILFYSEENGYHVAIGGKGKNVYKGKFDLIIDLGGDDVYDLQGSQDIFGNNFNCIIDISGNDYYTSSSDFSLGGSIFSSGFIFDKEGDDTYKGTNITLGSAIGGMGLLYDEKGNDTYYANTFSIGAASFGIGLVVDKNGNDIYSANTYSQGFGMTEGAGAIVDNNGNDSYLINSLSVDLGRYEDHYISMCQGYGLGLRPYYAGGVGLIIEGVGNDIYNTDIFGQGGSYWYSLGAIVDESGHDKYNSYQYAQGSGIHLSVGLLKDYDGWDFYSSNGVSQGCGHDYGFGFLYDVKGNDNYSAYSLSQGAGNANGIGMLIDESGRDGYLNKEPPITRGYGNPRREYGSIGVFLDASGDDFYSVAGMDSALVNRAIWGVSNDFYLKDLPSQVSGSNFKVELAVTKKYTPEENFIMAKTIEPRFSKWQEYGFNNLVEDSIGTAKLMLTKLATDDHRETSVMRNLILKIPVAVSTVFIDKLNEYKSDKSVLTPEEVNLMAFLFGETRSPIGKEALLELTYDDNLRVRSAAVNALGKLKIDSADTDFIERASARLLQLVNEGSTNRVYVKDIAYALNNFKSRNSFDALKILLAYDFYGVRLTASDNLRKYWNDYYNSDFTGTLAAGSGEMRLLALISSLKKLDVNSFRSAIISIIDGGYASSDVVKYNLIDIINDKRLEANEESFNSWAENTVNTLKEGAPLKVN